MREIVLDVETTGLWINAGHRVIEIACIELDNYKPTGRLFHRYVNPLLARMPAEAFEIHGIPIEFLWRHAPFKSIADSLLEFIGTDQVIIHNAAFDLGFINNELRMIGMPPLAVPYLDTLAMARTQFPSMANSLDALCRRFGVDLASRRHHGAMIDCALLAAVYFDLIGGKQPLFHIPTTQLSTVYDTKPEPPASRPRMIPRPHPPLSAKELENFTTTLGQIKTPLWIWSNQKTTIKKVELLDDEIPF